MSRSDLPHPAAALRRRSGRGRRAPPRAAPAALVGLGVAAALFAGWRAARALHAADLRHPPDGGRRRRYGDWRVEVVGAVVDRPRDEVYRFWREVSNLPLFLDHVGAAHEIDGVVRGAVDGPGERPVAVIARLVSDRPGEEIAWASTEASEVETRGKIRFRDAPGGRGTEVEAIVAYIPPPGRLGAWIRRRFRRDPDLRGGRGLRRLNRLMEREAARP